MNLLWRFLGRVIWWLLWPAFWVYLSHSQRTRLLLVDKSGKVLVVKGWLASSDKWSLPGGGLHKSENPTDGLLREVREEVGLTLQPNQLRHLVSARIKNEGFSFDVHAYFAAVTDQPPLQLQRFEIIDAQWISSRDLSERNAEPDVLLAMQSWRGGNAAKR